MLDFQPYLVNNAFLSPLTHRERVFRKHLPCYSNDCCSYQAISGWLLDYNIYFWSRWRRHGVISSVTMNLLWNTHDWMIAHFLQLLTCRVCITFKALCHLIYLRCITEAILKIYDRYLAIQLMLWSSCSLQ